MPSRPLPTAAGCVLHDAGLDWDAIRVPQHIGLAAMVILGGRCGAVAEAPYSMVVYYFVPRGTAAEWHIRQTRAIGQGGTIAIPSASWTHGPGPHWRNCPEDSCWLTDARALKAALEHCLHRRPGSEQPA